MSERRGDGDVLYAAYEATGAGGRDEDGGERAARWFARKFILRELEAAPRGPVLELGAGHGLVIDALLELGVKEIRGIDSSAAQVSRARNRGVNVELLDGLSALKREAGGSLSGVLALDVLEHLTLNECIEWMQMIRNRLAVGGRLVIRVPNGSGLFGPEVRWGDLTHRRAFTRSSLCQLFRASGLTPIKFLPLRPPVLGIVSGIRHVTWRAVELLVRVGHTAETGVWNGIMTRNLVAVAERCPSVESEGPVAVDGRSGRGVLSRSE